MRLVIFLLLWSFASCGEPNSQHPKSGLGLAALPPPPGWVLYPNPATDHAVLQCANHSRREWRVILDGDNVKTRLDTLSNHQEPLPPNIRSGSVVVGSKGTRHVAQVDDGSLIGLDVGEFGGGLWWFSSDGKSSKRLSEENVLGFVKTRWGILALVGLAHMGTDYGQVLRVGDGAAGNRRIEVLANLGAAPRSFVIESPDSFLVLTTRDLVRVAQNAAVHHLLPVKYGLLYPNSMTLGPSGILHIGMRHFVTRLTPTEGGYKEEWFVPAGCLRFAVKDYDCECLSNGSE